jgi:hypothetical protein
MSTKWSYSWKSKKKLNINIKKRSKICKLKLLRKLRKLLCSKITWVRSVTNNWKNRFNEVRGKKKSQMICCIKKSFNTWLKSKKIICDTWMFRRTKSFNVQWSNNAKTSGTSRSIWSTLTTRRSNANTTPRFRQPKINCGVRSSKPPRLTQECWLANVSLRSY